MVDSASAHARSIPGSVPGPKLGTLTPNSIPSKLVRADSIEKGMFTVSTPVDRGSPGRLGAWPRNSTRPTGRSWDELQRDGRVSLTELGKRVNLSASATTERVKRLEGAGVITGYGARVDLEKVGYPVMAVVRLKYPGNQHQPLHKLLSERSEILECLRTTGDDCYVLKVAAKSMGAPRGADERLPHHGIHHDQHRLPRHPTAPRPGTAGALRTQPHSAMTRWSENVPDRSAMHQPLPGGCRCGAGGLLCNVRWVAERAGSFCGAPTVAEPAESARADVCSGAEGAAGVVEEGGSGLRWGSDARPGPAAPAFEHP